MSTRRRRDKRRRRWVAIKKIEMVWSMRNPDTILPNNVVVAGKEFATWRVRWVKLHG